MKVQLRNLLILLAFVLFTGGCASMAPQDPPEVVAVQPEVVETEQPAIPAARPKPHEYPVEPFKNDALYQLLVAEVAGYRGEYEIALEKYMQMAEETQDAGVAARATRLANYLKRDDLSLKASQIWAEAEPDNIDAHRHSADQLMRAGELEDAIYHMEAVKNLGGLANFDVFAYRAANLDEASQKSLLDAISGLLERHPGDHQLMFSKAVLLEQTGKLEESLALANELLAAKQNVNVTILKVNILRNLHRSDEALVFLEDVIKNDTGENRRLRLIYARFLFEGEHLVESQKQYEYLLEQSPNDGDVLFALSLLAIQLKDDDTATSYLQQMIRWNLRVGEAHFYLGNISERIDDVPRAIREYKQVGRGYEFLPALSRIANLMIEQDQLSEMKNYMSNLRSENPGRADRLVMIEAQALSDQGMSTEVFELLDEMLGAASDNQDLLYFRAMMGQKFGRMDIMESDLLRVIELDPENSDALNALGYSLTDQTDRHEEALDLIKRALVIRPDEAAFIDSMGWVQYRLENFEEAVKYLRRALELFTNDEVAAHLGEVLWVIGEQTEASEVWQKALELKPDSDILKKVIERFTSP
ncbi:MAG: tetratricopeptide repeat protein [bacterium]|nr:tetratricopeptide repeat protein [Gammaproteobacteria bacterium]HIL95459.1 tetratricopeptide repeat protein [Pseudomonadales bacterium]